MRIYLLGKNQNILLECSKHICNILNYEQITIDSNVDLKKQLLTSNKVIIVDIAVDYLQSDVLRGIIIEVSETHDELMYNGFFDIFVIYQEETINGEFLRLFRRTGILEP